MARELTEKQKLFIQVLFDDDVNGDYLKAKRKAGFSDNTPTRDIVKSLRDEIIDATKDHILSIGPKAAFKMGEILDKPHTLGAREALAAAKELLDRVGIVKTEKVELFNAGVFIIPAKKKED